MAIGHTFWLVGLLSRRRQACHAMPCNHLFVSPGHKSGGRVSKPFFLHVGHVRLTNGGLLIAAGDARTADASSLHRQDLQCCDLNLCSSNLLSRRNGVGTGLRETLSTGCVCVCGGEHITVLPACIGFGFRTFMK